MYNDLRSLVVPSEPGRLELADVHQSPVGRCWTKANLCGLTPVGAGVVGEAVASSAVSASGMIDTVSRDTGAVLWAAWSKRENARLQKRSCCDAVSEGRKRGWEEMGYKCLTAAYRGTR